MIINLNELKGASVAKVGGKAFNLGKLSDMGVNIPHGFVITTDIFNDMSQTNASQIITEFDKLNTKYVAVRSSAIAEDGKRAAWAGQLDTFLNVTKEDLLNKIQACWDSINNPRAQVYAKSNGYNIEELKVAVIVQEMVQSEISGVAFSVNPVSQNQDNIVIEAVLGLGEAIVSGAVTPDTYVLDKKLNILNKTISTQHKMFSMDDGATEWADLDTEESTSPKLPNEQMKRLGQTVLDIETQFGYPVDVEWAIVADKIYITQTRPITTLNEISSPRPLYEPGTKIFRWGPIPGQWFYIAEYTQSLFMDLDDKYIIQDFPEANILIKDKEIVWLIAHEEFYSFCNGLFTKVLANTNSLDKLDAEWEASINVLLSFETTISSLSIDSFSDLKITLKDYQKYILDFWKPTLAAEFAGYGTEEVIKDLLAQYIDDERELGKAIQVLTTPTSPSFFQQADVELIETDDLKAYASKYYWLDNGYAGVKILDENYFDSMKQNLSNKIVDTLSTRINQNQVERAEWIDKYQIGKDALQACDLAIKIILQQDRRKAVMMRTQHFKELLAKKISDKWHISLDQLKYVSIKEIAESETIDTLKVLIAKRDSGTLGLAQSHDDTLFRFYTEDKTDHYWRHYLTDKNVDIEAGLRGLVASRSSIIRARGKVQIVNNPSEENFEEGSILVTQMTSPDYIHLMKKSAGIITDAGGLTCHAAILSRELGIPCIVGTRNATQVLNSGDMVEMDTHGGTIRVL